MEGQIQKMLVIEYQGLTRYSRVLLEIKCMEIKTITMTIVNNNKLCNSKFPREFILILTTKKILPLNEFMNMFYSESFHYKKVFQKHMNVNISQYNHTYIVTISICHMKM